MITINKVSKETKIFMKKNIEFTFFVGEIVKIKKSYFEIEGAELEASVCCSPLLTLQLRKTEKPKRKKS